MKYERISSRACAIWFIGVGVLLDILEPNYRFTIAID
jgi:hypothetical protein